MSTERTRFTIAVEHHVYEAFSDLAHASGVSLSRCIGDWLRDTAEAAQITTVRVNEVRKSNDEIYRAYLDSMARQAMELMEREGRPPGAPGKGLSAGRAAGGPALAGTLPARSAPPSPRPVIRGGKSPGKAPTPHGNRS